MFFSLNCYQFIFYDYVVVCLFIYVFYLLSRLLRVSMISFVLVPFSWSFCILSTMFQRPEFFMHSSVFRDLSSGAVRIVRQVETALALFKLGVSAISSDD